MSINRALRHRKHLWLFRITKMQVYFEMTKGKAEIFCFSAQLRCCSPQLNSNLHPLETFTKKTKSRFLHNKESEIEVAPEGWRVTSCSNRGIWSRGLKYYQQRGVGDLLNHTKLHASALFLFQKIPLCRRYHLCHPAYGKAMNWTFQNSCGLSPAMILSLKYLEAFASLSFQLEVLQSLFPYFLYFYG